MAEEEDNDASSKNAEPKKKPILLILVVVVLIGGAAAAGTILGPKLMGAAPAPAAEPPPAEESAPAAPDVVKDIVGLAPFIIDTRDADGMTHHVKVAVSIELKDGVPDADFRPYVPRGREAAIAYLRSQTFEELTNPARFEEVRGELSKRIIEAVGASRASRVLVIDFVGQ